MGHYTFSDIDAAYPKWLEQRTNQFFVSNTMLIFIIFVFLFSYELDLNMNLTLSFVSIL